MHYKFISLTILLIWVFLGACGPTAQNNHDHDHEHEHDHGDEVHLTDAQAHALGIQWIHAERRSLRGQIYVNGQLHVLPQDAFVVSSFVGATVKSIVVHEGEQVRTGQVMAYLEHPDIIDLQTSYLAAVIEFVALEKEYERQQTLLAEQVGSGRNLEETESRFSAMKSRLEGQKAKLMMIGIDPELIVRQGVESRIAVKAPANGYVTHIEIKPGQYIAPDSPMFEIEDLEHLHADLMIFERDMPRVKVGQKVKMYFDAKPGEEVHSDIHRISKTFEDGPKAMHAHAEVPNRGAMLLPGMFVRGIIEAEGDTSWVFPSAAVVQEGDKYYVFMRSPESMDAHSDSDAHDHEHEHDHDHDHGDEHKDHDDNKHDHEHGDWVFLPVEVLVGIESEGYIEVRFLQDLPKHALFAANSAYYLLAEWNKGEAAHEH